LGKIAAAATDHVQLWLVPHAGHTMAWAAHQEFEARLLEWFGSQPLPGCNTTRPRSPMKFGLKKIHRFYIFREAFTLNCGESRGGFTNSEQKKALNPCACTMRHSREAVFPVPGMVPFRFAHSMVQIRRQIYEYRTVNGF
jgi:hypothetical protein